MTSKIYFVELKNRYMNGFYHFCNGKVQKVDGMNDGKPFYHCITVNLEMECAPVPGNDTVIEYLDLDKIIGLVEITDEFMERFDTNTFHYSKFMYILSVLKRNL